MGGRHDARVLRRQGPTPVLGSENGLVERFFRALKAERAGQRQLRSFEVASGCGECGCTPTPETLDACDETLHQAYRLHPERLEPRAKSGRLRRQSLLNPTPEAKKSNTENGA